MKRLGLLTVWLVCAAMLSAQPAPVPPKSDQGTFLGILFSPIPELLYDQLPTLPRNQGVLITHVLPDSPAAQVELRRNDVLLQYEKEKIRDCERLAQLIQKDQPDHKIKLLLLRGGREVTVEPTLKLGLGLRIAATKATDGHDLPKGFAKPGTTAGVSVAATPLDQNKMKVAIEYYQEGTGRLRTITCEGTPAVIDGEVRKLPQRERAAVQTALQRIRALTQKDAAPVDR